jgi:hypothetical protein
MANVVEFKHTETLTTSPVCVYLDVPPVTVPEATYSDVPVGHAVPFCVKVTVRMVVFLLGAQVAVPPPPANVLADAVADV